MGTSARQRDKRLRQALAKVSGCRDLWGRTERWEPHAIQWAPISVHLGQGLHHGPYDLGSLFRHPTLVFFLYPSLLGWKSGMFSPAARVREASAWMRTLLHRKARILGLPDRGGAAAAA